MLSLNRQTSEERASEKPTDLLLPTQQEQQQTPVTTSVAPFSAPVIRAELALRGVADPRAVSSMEIGEGGKIYPLVCGYIAKNIAPSDRVSYRIESLQGGSNCCDSDSDSDSDEEDSDTVTVDAEENGNKEENSHTALKLGLGVFSFRWKDTDLLAIHQRLGSPVGSSCGVAFFGSLVIINPQGPDCIGPIHDFVDAVVAQSEKTKPNTFTMYRWHIKYQYWQRDSVNDARPLNSVIMPQATKNELVGDLKEFLSKETKRFYSSHGIPYKRSYLFYGAPGAGKTSLIQALAGRFNRNVCWVAPTHPELTDEDLKTAISRAPSRSIIVLEDIDALFGKDREKRIAQSPLTFSGLLNSLDGVGNSNGAIFILTTNFRDNLDSALIRNGRVDLHVEFTQAVQEQMHDMFRAYYPESEEALAESFAAELSEALERDGKSISPAALQHFFVTHRKMGAVEAAACSAADILAEIAHREEEKKQEDEAKEQREKAEKKRKKRKNGRGGGGDDDDDDDDDDDENEESGAEKKSAAASKSSNKAALAAICLAGLAFLVGRRARL